MCVSYNHPNGAILMITQNLSLFNGTVFLAHLIRISEILPLDRKSYLTYAILPSL